MRNWKTTLVGFGMAFANLYSGGMSWKNALVSAAMLVFGAVAKDYNVTGTSAPPSPDAATK